MKKIISFIMLGILLMMPTLYAQSVPGEEILHDEIERTVSQFNHIRKQMGLEALTSSGILNDMATSHTSYMKTNNVLSTIEENTLAYFRGRYPWDRASYYKYPLDFVYEFVDKGISNYYEGLNILLEDPVTRTIALNPMYKQIGMNLSGDYVTYDFGGNTYTGSQFITYPYDGARDVPIIWQGDSRKSLYEGLNAVTDKNGLPITISYYGSGIALVRNVTVHFINKETGDAISYAAKLPGDNHTLKNTLTILPLQPYDYGASYELSVNYAIILNDGTSKSYNKTIEFTAVKSVQTFVSDEKFMTRGNFIESLVKNEGLKFNLVEPLEYRFIDVDINTPRSLYIYTASDAGLIQGYPGALFRPQLNITKQEAYNIIMRAYFSQLGKKPLTIQKVPDYKDLGEVDAWAMDYVLKADLIGIVLKDDNKISPHGYLTENEFKAIMDRFNVAIQ